MYMKSEIVILGITTFFIANAYNDNKYMKQVLSMKKYYNMALIGFAGLSFYLFFKKNPMHMYSGINAARQLIKSLPVDKSASYMFDPIFNSDIDFSLGGKTPPLVDNHRPSNNPIVSVINQLDKGGSKTTKRSVGEKKKKYVASQQDWKCGQCKAQLNAWFEVDHIQSLENSGSNHVSNLVALCRECHGKKTAMERMGLL